MLLILLLISWTPFLDLTANLCLFQDFRFKIKLIICPTIPPFFHFLTDHNGRFTQVGYFTALLCTDNAVKRGFPSVSLYNG